METLEKLMPIVNGSFNQELSFLEMLEFNFEEKKGMAWNLIVSGGYIRSFSDVDPAVFTPMVAKYTHDMIKPENVDDILTEVRTEWSQYHKNLLTLTSNLYFRQGEQIYKAQKDLGFGGFIQMDARKLVGYICAGGSWNDFNHSAVSEGVRTLEALSPRFYRRNNPNNGQKRHYWTMKSDYITMVVDCITEPDLQNYLDFYKTHWQRVGQTIKADSIRMEQNEIGSGAFSLEFIFWWD